ncbi:alpha/beta hydrolase [Bradyrhizobium amphicarpaeae]|uniref:Alpha/beta hydrolase n=1 Tax=Bradyrhizobium amphicarpaeae TaxID=1404768 RepID=A0A2U8Q1D2_9BRAD|nr:alpha/beta hydrolase [Bradyrhizobium amphicarpaeae]AWM03844.1 alpha/beta hydrolase [Bradyrhizobium amphicarpaeae]
MWPLVVEIALISIAVYLAIAMVLIAWPTPAPSAAPGTATRELDSLVAGGELAEPAAPRHFAARDGAIRLYRVYPGTGSDVLVFLHGSSSDGRYLARLANALVALTGLTVVTPDMRGHGSEPGRRGDIEAVDRQEQDIADLIAVLRTQNSSGRFLLGGHSIGAGLAIRDAAGQEKPKPDGMVLIAPYIHRRSPAARPNSGGWATPFVPRFAGIEMLQRFGIHIFDGLPVLRFAVPPAARDGIETPLYSWRLFASVTPRPDWRDDIRRIDCPVLVLAAERDSIFRSEGYRTIFEPLARATVEVIPAIDHFQLVTSEEGPPRVARWLKEAVR